MFVYYALSFFFLNMGIPAIGITQEKNSFDLEDNFVGNC